MTTVQLDLFGETDARIDRTAEWQARFTPADWIAPYDCGYGPAGTVVRGWQCPDPECGQIEPNASLLGSNHGYDPTVPGHEPWNGRCARLTRLAIRTEAAS